MKQPKINIFGETFKVLTIQYDFQGNLNKIIYANDLNKTRMVFKENRIDCYATQTFKEIFEPTMHPYHNWICAPDLESLLVVEG